MPSPTAAAITYKTRLLFIWESSLVFGYLSEYDQTAARRKREYSIKKITIRHPGGMREKSDFYNAAIQTSTTLNLSAGKEAACSATESVASGAETCTLMIAWGGSCLRRFGHSIRENTCCSPLTSNARSHQTSELSDSAPPLLPVILILTTVFPPSSVNPLSSVNPFQTKQIK